MTDAKGFYDYDQRETGGISEEEFEEMDIGGYTSFPSPPPMEHPNSARSNSTKPATQTSDSKSITDEQASPEAENKDSMSSLGNLPSLSWFLK